SSTRPASMRGSFGATHLPFTRTYVGRFVVEKKPSGRTPSAGAGTKRASGKPAKAGWEKSGGENVGIGCNLTEGLCERQRQVDRRSRRVTPACNAAAAA